MGEEVGKDIISVSPDIVTPGGNLRRNSTGQVPSARAALSSSNGTEKVLPHYLRASTNSCHDFCKYGRKYAFEAKKRRPIRRKVTGDAGNSIEGEEQIKNVNLGDKKKKAVVKLIKAGPELKIESADQPKIIKQKIFLSLKKTEVATKPAIASKQRSATAKLPSLSNQSGVPSGKSSVNSPSNPSGVPNGRRKGDNISTSPGSSSGGRNSGRRASNHSSGLNGGRNNESLSSSLSGGSLNVKRNSEKKIPKGASLSESGERKELKTPKASPSPKKPSISQLPSLRTPKASSSPKPSVSRVPSLKTPKASSSLKPSISRVPSLKALSYRSRKMVSHIVNRNRGRKVELSNQQTMEKTHYIIEPKQEDKSSEPIERDKAINQASRSSLSLSSLASCPSLSSDEEEKANEGPKSELIEGDNTAYGYGKTGKNRDEKSKGEDKRRLRRSAMIHPEDKDCMPEKLKFQRGKVVNAVPENSGPRRLKFRQGRVVGENQESDNGGPKRLKFRQGRVLGVSLSGKALVGRRSFRRNRDSGNGDANATKSGALTVMLRHQDMQGKKEEQGLFNEVIEETANKLVEARKSKVKALVGRRSLRRNRGLGNGDANATKSGVLTVMLRHQDVQGKKGEQGLFNEVIEETANRLVETRKSKVKALVGAFETVISLQEGKSASTV